VKCTLWLVQGDRQYPVLSGDLDQCMTALDMAARNRLSKGWRLTARTADRAIFSRGNQVAAYVIQRETTQ
jgi:hypothetical protein